MLTIINGIRCECAGSSCSVGAHFGRWKCIHACGNGCSLRSFSTVVRSTCSPKMGGYVKMWKGYITTVLNYYDQHIYLQIFQIPQYWKRKRPPSERIDPIKHLIITISSLFLKIKQFFFVEIVYEVWRCK